MRYWLTEQGYRVNVKRVRRQLRQMGLEAIYPKPRLSQPGPDIGSIPIVYGDCRSIDRTKCGAAINVCTSAPRFYLSGSDPGLVQSIRSGMGSVGFFRECVLRGGAGVGPADRVPEIFNTDQGAQLTSEDFTGRLEQSGITINMDGPGRAMEDIFVELLRSVKYEEVYLHDYERVEEAIKNLGKYFLFYNQKRPHQSLGYQSRLRYLPERKERQK